MRGVVKTTFASDHFRFAQLIALSGFYDAPEGNRARTAGEPHRSVAFHAAPQHK
jgi:hypothetical protein